MAGIRWGKLSGKNRGGTCNGGKGRKCEKSDGKDTGAKGKEDGMKNRGLLRGRCVKTSVIDGALIEIKSSLQRSSKSFQDQEGMMKKIEPCLIKGKPDPYCNILLKEAVIKKSDSCENGFDAPLNKIKSKPYLNHKRVGVLKQFESSADKGVDAECNEKLADGSIKCKGNEDVKQGMSDDECVQSIKHGTRDTQCLEDVKMSKLDRNRGQNATQGTWDNEYAAQRILDVKHGLSNHTPMLHVGLDVNSVEKERKAHLCSEGGDAKCTDSTNSVVSDKAGDADCMKVGVHDKAGGADCIALTVPHDFLCGISKRVMEDPVVVASGQTFERACIQAWLDEGNTLCPVTHEPLSNLQLIPNLTLKALISSWYSRSHASDVKSSHHSFSSCISSFSSCPSLMTPHHQSFVSCSSFSVSKLLEETELYSSTSSSSSSLPKLLMDAELHSSSSSSVVSVPSYDTPEHLRVAGIHNFSSPSSTGSPLSSWEQEIEVLSLQENMESRYKMRGEDETAMSKILQRGNSHSKSNDAVLLSAKPCAYIVSRINSLVSDLHSEYLDIQRSAAAELRLLAKHDDSNRLMIASAGAIRPLVALLWSRDDSIQLEATTALLNLSLNASLKDGIVKEGAIEALVSVLRDGFNTGAKENAAVTLACLATSEENKIKIGSASAVRPLVNLLERGSPRGRKDAAAALYRLSSNDENKRRIIRAGASRLLIDFMSKEGDRDGMVDKAIAILGNLVSVEEGRVAFVEEGGIVSLMEVLRTAPKRSKGLAVFILSHLCNHSSEHRLLVSQKDPLPILMELSKTVNVRLKAQIAEVIQILIVDAY